jgi:hypothetical protein
MRLVDRKRILYHCGTNVRNPYTVPSLNGKAEWRKKHFGQFQSLQLKDMWA